MIGTYTIVKPQNSNISDNLKKIHKDDNISISYTGYDGYPVEYWKDEDRIIVLEGLIYNFSDEQIKEKIKSIANNIQSISKTENEVKKFINECDGDYVIHILNPINKLYILFNDFMGRLPIYYYNKEIFIISREIKFILKNINEISFNKNGIIEFLRLAYTLGENTIFENVKRLEPASMIFLNYKETFDNKVLKIGKLIDNRASKYKNKDEAIKELSEAFISGTKNRINRLKDKGYKLVSDLSGGYDSRTVFGGLQKITKDIEHYTLEYIIDESKISKKLFEELESPGKFIKLNFDNSFNEDVVEKYVYETDSLVDYYTTVVCYQDQIEYRKTTGYNTARFMGFGGEFIRHPLKRSNKITFYKERMIMKYPSSDDYSEIFIDKNKKNNQLLKNDYYSYYCNHVVRAGEERSRKDFWTVQPMMSLEFIKLIHNRLPLNWTGYRFHTDFLKSIDNRLLNVPIFNSKIDLKSKLQLFYKDFYEDYLLPTKGNIYKIIDYYSPHLIKLWKRKKKESNDANIENIISLFDKYFSSLEICNKLFDYDLCKKELLNFGGYRYNRLVTLLIYYKTLEDKFKDKIKI